MPVSWGQFYIRHNLAVLVVGDSIYGGVVIQKKACQLTRSSQPATQVRAPTQGEPTTSWPDLPNTPPGHPQHFTMSWKEDFVCTDPSQLSSRLFENVFLEVQSFSQTIFLVVGVVQLGSVCFFWPSFINRFLLCPAKGRLTLVLKGVLDKLRSQSEALNKQWFVPCLYMSEQPMAYVH